MFDMDKMYAAIRDKFVRHRRVGNQDIIEPAGCIPVQYGKSPVASVLPDIEKLNREIAKRMGRLPRDGDCCPKCGKMFFTLAGRGFVQEYRDSSHIAGTENDMKIFNDEYILVTCVECGYSWRTMTYEQEKKI